MNVNKKEREGLERKIVEVLGEILVFPVNTDNTKELFQRTNWNIAPDFFNKCRQLRYPLKKHNQDFFINLFGELGPYDIVFNKARRLIYRKPWNAQLEGDLRLIEFLSHAETEQLAVAIANDILSFPHEYMLFVELGKSSTTLIDYELSSRVSIRRPIADIRKKFIIPPSSTSEDTPHKSDQTNKTTEQYWRDDINYLHININGYLPQYDESNFKVYCEDRIYSIVGLASSLGFLNQGLFIERYQGYDTRSEDALNIPVFDISNNQTNPQYVRSLTLPDSAKNYIRNLGISEYEPLQLDIMSSIVTSIETPGVLGEAATKILGASRWYFDSISEHNQTHAFIQAMVGVEILLGDAQRRHNLTDRLTDRIAFLLATSLADRQEIRDEFEALYKLRSEIIHGGTFLLPQTQISQLGIVQNYLRKVISIEATNFHKHMKPSTP